MSKLIFSGPINSLSFGNVTYNFLRSLYKKGVDVYFFPIGKDLDFSAFDSIDPDLQLWIESSYRNRFSGINRDIPSLKMWHISGSETSISPRNFLYTFHETSSPTEFEKSICNLQSATIVSSSYSKELFIKDCPNSRNVPIGFDEDFHVTGK